MEDVPWLEGILWLEGIPWLEATLVGSYVYPGLRLHQTQILHSCEQLTVSDKLKSAMYFGYEEANEKISLKNTQQTTQALDIERLLNY